MLGNKRYSNKSLGVKSYSSQSLGNKNYSGFGKGNTVNTNADSSTALHNYSNSSEAHKEPIKGVHIGKVNSSHFQIEKHHKKHSESKENIFM